MRLVRAVRDLARWIVPACLLVRRPEQDADDQEMNRRTTERAHRVVDRFEQSTEMQRALHFERLFWERHGEDGNGNG